MTRILDKLLLLVYSLIVLAGSVAALGMAARLIPRAETVQWIQQLYGPQWGVRSAVIAVGALLLLLSLRFLYIALRRSSASAPSIDQRTEIGDVRISIETVENLALKAASRHRGVKDLRARVRIAESGIDIMIRAVVDGESAIPALSEEIQRTVKEHVEDITGIPVSNVAVYVANIIQSQSFKSRVE